MNSMKTAMLATTAAAALLGLAPAAWAQTTPQTTTPVPSTTQLSQAAQSIADQAEDNGQSGDSVGDIVVVGSQIRGADVTAALPVTVLSEEQILATGAVNGDDLLRSAMWCLRGGSRSGS